MKPLLRKLHKYLGLFAGVFWLLQALSGIVLVYHRTIDDALLGASGQPANLKIIDQTIQQVEQETQARVVQYFVSGGSDGQVDLLLEQSNGERDLLRIDGATGAVLRNSSLERPLSGVTPLRVVLLFHKELLAGTLGHWIVGISGALLFSSILMGLKLAWPMRNRWRATLLPTKAGTLNAKYYGWHRAVGLWLAPLGLIIAATGALMVWNPTPWHNSSPTQNTVRPLRPGETMIASSAAVQTALAAFANAKPAIVTLPAAAHPWYSIRVRQPGELRRVFGTTQVYIDARTGELLSANDALNAPLTTRFIAALWPIHNGEWGGAATRLLTLLTGLWLAALSLLGLRLYWLRRR